MVKHADNEGQTAFGGRQGLTSEGVVGRSLRGSGSGSVHVCAVHASFQPFKHWNPPSVSVFSQWQTTGLWHNYPVARRRPIMYLTSRTRRFDRIYLCMCFEYYLLIVANSFGTDYNRHIYYIESFQFYILHNLSCTYMYIHTYSQTKRIYIYSTIMFNVGGINYFTSFRTSIQF